MFEAAIFDWDGTLADSRHAIVVSFHRALAETGIAVTTEYIERRIGIGASDTFRELLRENNRPIDEDVVKRLVQKKSEIQIELAGEVKLFTGVRELLEALQGKVKVGLASMNNRNVISHLLQTTDLQGCFQEVLTVEQVTRSKPDPEIFLKTAQALNAAPQRCVVFEDSIFGVKAAKAAGMACVATTTGVYGKDELAAAEPDLIVETLSDPKILPFVLG
ncbi:MAG: HAD family phosphatase [Candidatus Bathyarchaeota archaeon]|nr:HAD family phosphatase [Candidatus Bathyarchaeota archaeon]